MNELIISGIAIHCRHTWVRLIFVYAFILSFSSVLIYGNRSSFSNQTHTMLSYMQINIRCTTTTCRAFRDSIENNKQHAGGIEQISKKKSSLCARLFNRNKHHNEWSMNEADNSKEKKKREMNGQKGFTFN